MQQTSIPPSLRQHPNVGKMQPVVKLYEQEKEPSGGYYGNVEVVTLRSGKKLEAKQNLKQSFGTFCLTCQTLCQMLDKVVSFASFFFLKYLFCFNFRELCFVWSLFF